MDSSPFDPPATSSVVHPRGFSDRAALFIAGLFTRSPAWSLVRPLHWYLRAARARRLNPVYFNVGAPHGDQLEALYLRSSTPASGRLPVLFVHGYWLCKEMQLGAAELFRASGHDVLMLDLRAHGGSGGDETTFGVKERHSLVATLDEAQRRGWLPDDKVITAGLSLGAATALQHAPLDPRVAKVIAFAPFVSAPIAIESYRQKYFPWFSAAFVRRAFDLESARAGWCFDDASPLVAIGNIKVPILLVVGSLDTNLGLESHTRPLANAKTQGECELHIVEGANHFNLFRHAWPGLGAKVSAFCAKT